MGAGTTNEIQEYSQFDICDELTYYRLTQTDF